MLQTAGIPYVKFSTEAVPYQNEQGHTLYRNQYFVSITSKGSKDSVYKDAESWITELKTKSQARQGFDMDANMYDEWYRVFSEAFKRYKEGQELLFDGTPIKSSMAFTPAEVAICESLRIFSLEDLAKCNEESIQRMGIGGRNMKTKAAKILENNEDGHIAEENAALRVKLANMEAMLDAAMKAIPEPKKGWPVGQSLDEIQSNSAVEAPAISKSFSTEESDTGADNMTAKLMARPRGRPRNEDVAA